MSNHKPQNMKPLDRNSPEIKRTKTILKGEAACTISSSEKIISLSITATELLNAKAGRYLHFVQITEGKIALYVNDNADGYKLIPTEGGYVKVYAMPLIRFMLDQMNISKLSKALKFRLERYRLHYEGHIIYELKAIQ